MPWQEHPDPEVQQAIIALSNVLCSYERMTGRESVLVIREQGGFVYRAQSGKPGIPDDVTDEMLLAVANCEPVF